jgi:hypothetical protein
MRPKNASHLTKTDVHRDDCVGTKNSCFEPPLDVVALEVVQALYLVYNNLKVSHKQDFHHFFAVLDCLTARLTISESAVSNVFPQSKSEFVRAYPHCCCVAPGRCQVLHAAIPRL